MSKKTNSNQILVVVSDAPPPRQPNTEGRQNLTARQAIVSAIPVTVEALADQLEETLQSIGDALYKAAGQLKPSSIEMTFGLEVNAEANILLGKLGGASNISVTLKWDSEVEKNGSQK